ncbi:MAG: FAD-dependent oxidoreductase [Alphaproteobacteria bacterium]|nr:FAD-dependent oxidoreductase [Alphaproteobacteria bacterium]
MVEDATRVQPSGARTRRTRIAIVGGGLSGLTAAFELSRTPELRRRFEVTVYERSWRLGGKLASGRNAPGQRNEEHGLHVWFGFYANTFGLADEVYRRWKAPPDCPFETPFDFLEAHHVAMFAERVDPASPHRVHRLHLPRSGGSPLGADVLPGATQGLVAAVDLLRIAFRNALDLLGRPSAGPRNPGPFWHPREPSRLLALLTRVLETTDAGRRQRLGARLERRLALLQRGVQVVLARIDRSARVWQPLATLDLAVAMVRGLIHPDDGILLDGDLDRIGDRELRAWLAQRGAHPLSLAHSVVLAGQYDAFFQFADGDRDRPCYEASTATRIVLRGVFGYHGAVAWLLQTGMGEAFISPLYEVLVDQGVRFRFFHRLDALELDGGRVAGLRFTREARLRGGIAAYAPLSTVRGQRCWTAAPDPAQVERCEEPVCVEDFDAVVMALPLGVLAPDAEGGSPVRAWLDRVPAARRAASAINLQASVAAQLWLDRPIDGFPGRASVVGWSRPYSVFCDMTPVLAHEAWGADGPVCTLYLCGVDRHTGPGDAADEAALARLGDQLERAGSLLHEGGFDWSALHDPDGRAGRERLRAQYVRFNVEPTDLCDGAVPGTARLRLEAHQSGLENLAIASTWTRTGLNTTCVEAAVMSGMAAARALGACDRPIVGEDFLARPAEKGQLAAVSAWRT